MSPEKKIILKKIKKCFHIYLDGKNNENVGLYPTFLVQEITRNKYC